MAKRSNKAKVKSSEAKFESQSNWDQKAVEEFLNVLARLLARQHTLLALKAQNPVQSPQPTLSRDEPGATK